MTKMIISPTIISLREGIEAALIIAIMLSYLRKTNQGSLRKYVLYGTGVAILSSVGVAIIVGLLWGIFEGPMLTIFEGSVVLIAAGLLTTMIIWMWNAGARVTQDIEDSMAQSVIKQSGVGLALLSFSLVVREGVELSLFSMALVIQEGIQSYIGITLGLSLAIILGIGIYKGSLKIGLGQLFKWTSIFLILFAAGMVAYGIHELQEAGLLLFGSPEVWNINPPLLPDGSYPLLHDNGAIGGLAKALFGYNGNPSALEVVAYVTYLVVAFSYLWMKQKNMNTSKQSQQKADTTVTPIAQQ
ncbi:high-affinity iron transporter [Candidatus Thorarchaeota archaeon]|nr:MAG: high-affinity iron transporter [Candidatus Thorarchaeota archaeon]